MSIWLICNDCGHSKVIYSEQEVFDNEKCILCEGKMVLDINKGEQIRLDNDHKAYEESLGDNFPTIPNLEKEMRDSISTLGVGHTWYMIEAITNIKLRLQYRTLFFKCGGTIPEREN